jgi:hypothetical protein
VSRTDKHAPYWTWATWYEPAHALHCRDYAHRSWHRGCVLTPCNLPEHPVRHAGRRPNRLIGMCTWEPVWPRRYEDALRITGHNAPPRWFRRHRWFGPERVRERDRLGKLAKEYNANGELDDGDFPNPQHRHGALWDWH